MDRIHILAVNVEPLTGQLEVRIGSNMPLELGAQLLAAVAHAYAKNNTPGVGARVVLDAAIRQLDTDAVVAASPIIQPGGRTWHG